MQEGDIYFVEIPASNGHEQAGLRPAIMLDFKVQNKAQIREVAVA